MVTSARLFFRGPIWKAAGVTDGVLAILTVVAFARGHSLWPWLLAAIAVVIAIASFLSFHRARLASESQAESLPQKLDALSREGIAIRNAIDKPPEPQRGSKSVSYNLSPDPSLWGEVDDFYERAYELLVTHRPSLIVDFNKGLRDALREQRKMEKRRDLAEKDRDNATKLRSFMERSHQRPAKSMDALLWGLAAARNRLGD